MSPDSKVRGANMGPIWGRQDPGGPHVGPMNFAMWVSNNSTTATPHIKCRHCNIPMVYDSATMDLMSILLGILHPTYHEILIHTYLEVTIFHETLVLELTIIYWSLSKIVHTYHVSQSDRHPPPPYEYAHELLKSGFSILVHVFLFQFTSNSLQIWYNNGFKYAEWIWVFRCW